VAYSQDTIIDVNAANVLAGILDGLLTTAGWSVVESLTPSGSYRTKVYKSAGTDNGAGYDWYIVIMWNSIGTEQQLEIMAGGAYDTGSHTLSEIAGYMQGTGSNPAFVDVVGALCDPRVVNVNVDTNTSYYTHGQPTTKPWFACIVPSSAFGYWASVTLDHVAVFTTITGNTTPSFLASDLALDSGYAALPFGVNDHPVIQHAAGSGISALMLGQASTNNANYVEAIAAFTHNYGAPLPILDGHYLDAFAWHPDWYLSGAQGAGGVPLWDNPGFGDGIRIGGAIDYYLVYGGSVGDTVEIDGATYVLSGNLPGQQSSGTGQYGTPCVAILVE